MSEIIMKMLLDCAVAGLLCATIFYCKKLNIRIKLLQDSKSELAQLIQQFDASTKAAVDSIQEIHRASRKISENIQAKLDKANYLANDLEFMIERAGKTADKIERQIKDGRGGDVSEPSKRSGATISKTEITKTEMVQRANNISDRNATPEKTGEKRGIEAMMDRITELKGSKTNEQTPQMRPMARLRSKAEQDLMQALKKDKS
jgi:hypothetical protein